VITEVLLAHLGVVAAVGGLFVSLTVSEAVAQYIRRRNWRARRLWIVALLIWLLNHAEKALAAVGFPRRKRARRPVAARGPAVSVASVTAAALLVVVAFTTADAVAGGSLVAHRRTTFFSGETHSRSTVLLELPTSVRAQAQAPVRVAYSASARDAKGRQLALSCSPASGTLFSVGTTVVHCSADGKSGSFSVIVARVDGPRLQLPTAVAVEAAGPRGAPAVWRTTTAPGAVVVCKPGSGRIFPIGATHVVCTARAGGRTTTDGFDVGVKDTTPPRIQMPALVHAATTADATVVTFRVAAVDTVDGTVAAICRPASGSTFSVGHTVVSCKATDSRHNSASRNLTVRVDHTSVPTPTLRLPAPTRREAEGPNGAPRRIDDGIRPDVARGSSYETVGRVDV